MATSISIHPPREGWDWRKEGKVSPCSPFQSTHPVRGGTPAAGTDANPEAISIHPPREGWDHQQLGYNYCDRQISIHPPREGWDA